MRTDGAAERGNMDEVLKNQANANEQPSGVESLAEMPAFEQHMAEMENAAEAKKQEKPGNFGAVYGEIAKNALIKWNGLSEEEASEKVANSTFEELESQVGAKGSISVACESVAKHLGIDGDALKNAVLAGEKQEETFSKAAEKMPHGY